jgi:Dihydropteroate synthase and related enzymes
LDFLEKLVKAHFLQKFKSDWLERDLSILKNLNCIKQNFPYYDFCFKQIIHRKILGKENTNDRLFGSVAAETISVMNGADIIRTHNVGATKDAVMIASKLSK